MGFAPTFFKYHFMEDDGSVWSWGANKKGQLGLGKPGNNQATPKQG